MRNHMMAVLVVFATLSGLAQAEVLINKSFALPDLKIINYTEPADAVTYQKLELAGCFSLADSAGYPELPYKIVRLLIPAGEAVSSIKIESYQSQPIGGDYSIYPAQPPQIIGKAEASAFVAPTPLIYEDSKSYPGKLYEIAGEGYMSGYHILTLRLYPIQYNPRAKKLTLYTDIRLKIKTQPGGQSAVPVYQRNESRQKEIEALVLSQIDNIGDMLLYQPQIKFKSPAKSKKGSLVQPLKLTGLPSSESMPVDYLIITKEELKSTFEQLATWKTKKGITSKVITVEWIGQNYNGCDLQEKIRYFIKDAYSYWGASYVLLAGEHTVTPVRYGETNYTGFPAIPADLYYSSLEGSWNANGNAVFGEPGTGEYVQTDPDNRKIYFLDNYIGRMIKGSLGICYTTDGGENWLDMASPTLYSITGLSFINNTSGWACGLYDNYVRIYNTTDEGNSWQIQYQQGGPEPPKTGKSIDIDNNVYGIDALTNLTCWAIGSTDMIAVSSKLWHTTDGQNWTESNGPDFLGYAIDFLDSDIGYIAGEAGKIAKTTDGGTTWQTFQTSAISAFRKIVFVNSQNGWACGDYGVIYHTSDGGASWMQQNSGTTQDLCDIAFVDFNRGWAISDLSILYTADGGVTWSQSANPAEWNLLSLSAVSTNDIWISGENGLLLHSVNGVDWSIKHSGILRWVVTGDYVDLLPDVAVGRAPVVSITETQTFVDKIISYEQSPPLTDYVTKMLFMGGSYGNENDGMMAQICERMQSPAYPTEYIGIPNYFSVYELYGPQNDWDVNNPDYPRWEGDAELTKANAASAMSQGYHLVYHVDHSYVYSIGAGAKTGGGQFNRVDAQGLTNDNKCSILFSLGCDPNAFDYDCFSRSFMINPKRAGVAFIGNSVFGTSGQVWQARNYFYYLLHGITKNGLAFINSANKYSKMVGFVI